MPTSYIALFNCDQYVLEFQPDDKSKETKFNIPDEDRLGIAPNPTGEIQPEEASISRPGGKLDPSFYPVEQIPLVLYRPAASIWCGRVSLTYTL